MSRPFCLACRRPEALCLCARIPRVANRTRVVILQHPRERFHPFGSARLLDLALEDSRLEVAWCDPETGRATRHPTLQPGVALLWPAPDAPTVESLPAAGRPTELLVLDATWTHARSLRADNPWLATLPTVRISPTTPSLYQVRREPRFECLSTLEATVLALRALEPELAGLDALIQVFIALNEEQLAVQRAGEGRSVPRRPRPRPVRGLARALTAPEQELVVVHVESAPCERGRFDGRRQLVQVAALRLGDGACLELFLRPEGDAPEPRLLEHMELAAADVAERGLDAASAADRLRAFLPAKSLILGWSERALRLLAPLAPDAPHECLRAIHDNVRRHQADRLAAATAAASAALPPLPIAGRAARRLAEAAAITRGLLDLVP